MFDPKYTISTRLLENIKRIAVLTQSLNGKTFSKTVLSSMERSARELSVFSSTSIEGNPLPLTDVKRILKNRPEHIRNTEREVLNYNKALEYLKLVSKGGFIDIDINLVYKIHKMITEHLLSDYYSGRIRNGAVFVNDVRLRKPIYLPPDNDEVQGLLQDLFDYIEQNKTKIDPLILAGIFHRQFVIIHPFMDSNGRTARLITKSVLARMCLDIFDLFSFENYYNQNVSNYFKTVGLSGNYYDIKDSIDFTKWLEYFTDGIIDELSRVQEELEKLNIFSSLELLFTEEQKKILIYLNKNSVISDRQYKTLTKRAKSTRSLDFKKLVDFGKIERMGKGKNTYYKLKT